MKITVTHKNGNTVNEKYGGRMVKTTLKINNPIIDSDSPFVAGDKVQLFDYYSDRWGDRWLLSPEGAQKPSAGYTLGCDGMHMWKNNGIRIVTHIYKNGAISVGKMGCL